MLVDFCCSPCLHWLGSASMILSTVVSIWLLSWRGHTLSYSAGGVTRFEVNNFTRILSSSSALSCPIVPSIPPFLPPHIVGDCEEGHHCGYDEIGKFFWIQEKLGMGNTLACRKLIQIFLWFLRWAIQAMGKPSLTNWNTETWSIAVTQRPQKKVNTPLFRKLDNITEDTYKVESCKKTIKLNLNIQVGFFVYQYAKLRML